MSVTNEEAAYDQYMAELYEEHKEEAIEEFAEERLQSYFVSNKLLAAPAFNALNQARSLSTSNPTAGLIFAAIAIEVGLKSVLLKPIVYGLVHKESLATLITDLTISTSMDRYRKLLFKILEDHGGVNINSYKRPCSNSSLWDEINQIQKKRNEIMHRAENASDIESSLAIDVATEIFEKIFPSVVNKLGLHLHEGYRVCDEWKCKLRI